MPRKPRIVVAGSGHHITHRGNNRQQIFFDDWCRRKYLDLVDEHTSFSGIQVLGYCLMSNHTHLLLVPTQEGTLSRCMQRIESEYASLINCGRGRRGHLWDGRYRSFVMDDVHLWAALRYVELNPVRAFVVDDPVDFEWSSARDHLGMQGSIPLHTGVWSERWGPDAWSKFLREPARYEEIREIRNCLRQSRPLGGEQFVKYVERVCGIDLTTRPGQRKSRVAVAASE